MALEDIRIKISGDAAALDPTIKKLEEIGAIDKKNAEQFKATSKEFEVAAEKRAILMREELEDLEELRARKRAAFDPVQINEYSKSIKESEGRVKALKMETEGVAAVSNVGFTKMTTGVKGLYSMLRTAANIIPGIGISGLILAGYELLSKLVSDLTDNFKNAADAQLDNIETGKHLLTLSEEQIKLLLEESKLLLKIKVLKGQMSQQAADDSEKELNKTEKLRQATREYGKLLSEEAVKRGIDLSQLRNGVIPTTKLEDVTLDISESELSKRRDFNIAKIKLEAQFQENVKKIITNSQKEIEIIDIEAQQKAQKEKDKEAEKAKQITDKHLKEVAAQQKKSNEEVNEVNKEFQKQRFQDEDEFKQTAIKNRKYEIKKDDEEDILRTEKLKELKSKDIIAKDKLDIGYLERKLQREEESAQDSLATEKALLEAKKKLINDEEELRKKALEDSKIAADSTIKIGKSILQSNIETIDHKEKLVAESIAIQEGLAERGLKNDLAFETKRQSELEKKRMQEQKRLIKLKELETFLNAVASFSKDDPKTAVAKALAEVALVKGAEAVYMEEGGLLGHNNQLSRIGRKHTGGGDILVHAQTGEGILSRRDIMNMGGKDAFFNFKEALANPINELPLPMSAIMVPGMNTRGIEQRLDSLEKTIKNKAETSIDFDNMGNMLVSVMENGIKTSTKHVLIKKTIGRA